MTRTEDEIKRLTERFFEGETTLDEEEVLYAYYSQTNISEIDVQSHPRLRKLVLQQCSLSTLDVSKNVFMCGLHLRQEEHRPRHDIARITSLNERDMRDDGRGRHQIAASRPIYSRISKHLYT